MNLLDQLKETIAALEAYEQRAKDVDTMLACTLFHLCCWRLWGANDAPDEHRKKLRDLIRDRLIAASSNEPTLRCAGGSVEILTLKNFLNAP